MIKVANIYKRINGIDILNDISLTVQSNKITVLTGLSGSGKSVLLKIIVGLMHPDSGKILIEGKSITDLKGIQLMKIRQKMPDLGMTQNIEIESVEYNLKIEDSVFEVPAQIKELLK